MTSPPNQFSIEAALAHHQAGRLHEAEGVYRHILSRSPDQTNALHLLGVLASQVGQHGAAIDLISRAIALDPNQSDFHGNLGVALSESSRFDEAIRAFQRAIALNPSAAPARNNLANVLLKKGNTDEAIAILREAIMLQQNYADPHYNLANIYKDSGRLDEAVARYRHALALRPDWLQAWNNLGNALCAQGDFAQATEVARQAMAKRPGNPLAHWNLGLMLLRHGDLEHGLPEYEWRWKAKELGLTHPDFSQPKWDGGDLAGKTILLHAEQGFGDTIQFIRYAPLVAAGGGRVIVACQKELHRLFRNFSGVAEWIDDPRTAKNFDVHCPLASLPAVMKTTLRTIPASCPYLIPDPQLSADWQRRLTPEKRLKFGLAWAGRPTHPRDKERSMSLAHLRPLLEVPDIAFFSLQKTRAAGESGSGLNLIDWTAELNDFADTAALISNLDLIITVDTAIAHLAGAMGKPVWVLLPIVPDWRWMLERTDSPWYPTLRLWRQNRLGDWETPMGQVAKALASFSRS